MRRRGTVRKYYAKYTFKRGSIRTCTANRPLWSTCAQILRALSDLYEEMVSDLRFEQTGESIY